MENTMNLRITEDMENFKELSKLAKELNKRRIWAYLEIATVIDEFEKISDEQKQEAYNIASTEFKQNEDTRFAIKFYAWAAIETVLDEKYQEALTRASGFNVHDLFADHFKPLVLFY